MLEVFGKNGVVRVVSQGFGLGIRQHDDVMLAFGYSRVASKDFTVPTTDFLVLRLDVNDVKLHHLESRLLGSSAGNIRIRLYNVTGNENLFPATPTALDIYNQKYLTKETIGVDVRAGIYSYPIQTTNPFSGLEPIINRPIYTPTTGGPITPAENMTNKGRHYEPNQTYALVIENISNGSSVIYYEYNWHEIW